MKIKQGAGNTEGDLYQLWLGVSIIKDWILSGNNINGRENFWLEQEIGKSNAGIFDDIQVFEKDEYQFYQVKHTINIKGDLITYDDLINPESKISIQKIYDSYVKIKKLVGYAPFKLIIFSNKTAGNKLGNKIKSNGQFINTIKYVNPRAKSENREIINQFLNLCECTETELKDILNHLYFSLGENDLEGLSSKVKQDLDDPRLVDHIFDLVDKSHRVEFKIHFNTIEYYLNVKKSKFSGFNIFVEKNKPPNLLLIRENIDLLKTTELNQETIKDLLWEIRYEVHNIINCDHAINQEMLVVVEELADFLYSYMKDKNEIILEPIYSSLYLLTLKQKTIKYIKMIFYDYFVEIYENNKTNKDLVNILDNCKHFGNRIDEILEAIKNRNEIVIDALSLNLKNDLIFSRVNFTSKEKFYLRKKLLIAIQSLNLETDKRITNEIKDLRRILKRPS